MSETRGIRYAAPDAMRNLGGTDNFGIYYALLGCVNDSLKFIKVMLEFTGQFACSYWRQEKIYNFLLLSYEKFWTS